MIEIKYITEFLLQASTKHHIILIGYAHFPFLYEFLTSTGASYSREIKLEGEIYF